MLHYEIMKLHFNVNMLWHYDVVTSLYHDMIMLHYYVKNMTMLIFVQNTRDFVQQMENIQLQQNECISYDVKALFTSVPIEPAIEIINKHLEDDKELQQKTSMTVNHIICLLEFCLKNTCFIFQGRYYEQIEGAPMGSPRSPIVANLYMEAFEVEAINSAPHPHSLWSRFVDDTFVVIQASHKDRFIQCINSIDNRIQFTMEDCRSDGSMPLDTLVIPKPDSSFSTTVYRKPIHTDLYQQGDSHHTIAAKYSVMNTLHHRARAVCSNQWLLKKEEDHLQKVLLENKHPIWALNRVKMEINAPAKQDQNKRGMNINTNATCGNQKPYMVVPYVKGLSESLKNVCRKHGVQIYCKGSNTIKSLLMAPKDKDPITKKSGIIYR